MENGWPEKYIIFPRVEKTIERIKNIAGGVAWLALNQFLHESPSEYPKHPERMQLPVGDLEDDGGYWDQFNLEADVKRQLHETEVIDGTTEK